MVMRNRGATFLYRWFISVLNIALIGYAFGGRGFAYLGFSPIYIDSILWLFAFIVLLLNPGWVKLLRNPITWLLLTFMTWGAIRTFVFIPTYGIDALRDGAMWGYALFALAVGYPLAKKTTWYLLIKWYEKWFFVRYVIWAPLAFLTVSLFKDYIPKWPWGPGEGVPLIQLKAGDIAVHISGILSFALVVLPYFRKKLLPIKWIIFWLFWFASFVIVASKNRGGFLSIAAVLLLLLFHINPLRWTRMALVGLALLLVFYISGIEIDMGGRKISITQIANNAISILTTTQSTSLEGTKNWRLEWWRVIINYTVHGPYFWTGKGFGINLADDDGFQLASDHSLRSPHNGHLTILARMGVPGFALWLIMQTWFAAALWWNYLKKRWQGLYREAALFLWILTYWLAASINATFDVYLEGPQGGIWFWSIFGAGLGLMLAENRK